MFSTGGMLQVERKTENCKENIHLEKYLISRSYTFRFSIIVTNYSPIVKCKDAIYPEKMV